MNRPTFNRDSRPSGRIAAVDYGRVRIGIAMADLETAIAIPFETYSRRDDAADQAWFQRLVDEQRLVRFVVGLPVHCDGRESPMSAEAREFGTWLAAATGVRVVYFDERFTSIEADSVFDQVRLTNKKRRQRRDSVAAQILLTAYMEAGVEDPEEPKPL